MSHSVPAPSSPLAAVPERPSVRARRVQRKDALWGALCVVGSAVAFSAKAVIAKVGYRHGADPATLSGTIDLDSNPQGAQAATSLGSGCETPCAMEISAAGPFTVTFTHPGYAPATVDVRMQSGPGVSEDVGSAGVGDGITGAGGGPNRDVVGGIAGLGLKELDGRLDDIL